MLLIPIRTEMASRYAPVANVALVGLNILIFAVLDLSQAHWAAAVKDQHFILDAAAPRIYQFITYQFAHADFWHLAGNMLFLWVFGNAVNAKMGDIAYVFFYLAGGAFAGQMFAWVAPEHSLLGASGAIAAVTTAYLVLFPRSRVTVLYAFFFIGFFEVPAMIIIGVKIILWDNIVSPAITSGGSQVAYSAHLAGYTFGILVAFAMLLLKAVNRDQFDMLALIKRWNQRRAFASVMRDPKAQAQAQFGRVARVNAARPEDIAQWERQMDRRTELRAEIADRLRRNDTEGTLPTYECLLADDPTQCLPADQQMSVARAYYAKGRAPQAAAAFERFLAVYKNHADANEVRLLLGIIHARDLQQRETARGYLTEALAKATNPDRRELAQHWLDQIN